MKTKEQIHKEVERVIQAYRNLNRSTKAADVAGCLDPDGRLWIDIWNSFETMLDLIDFDGWIAWFIWDNELGKKALGAGYNGGFKKIRTTKQLASLIYEGMKRNTP